MLVRRWRGNYSFCYTHRFCFGNLLVPPMMLKYCLRIGGLCLLAIAGLGYAEEPVATPPRTLTGISVQEVGGKSEPHLVRLADGRWQVGLVTVDNAAGTLAFPAEVNMAQGLLEYLLVRQGGKTHESLLRTAVDPYDIQLACLLLNFHGTDQPLAHQGAKELPQGDHVRIRLSLSDGSRVEPERWLSKVAEGQPQELQPLQWVYTGSRVNQGRFMSQLGGSIVALYHDPDAIFDNASPGGENNRVWFVDPKSTPAPKTPVTVSILLGQ